MVQKAGFRCDPENDALLSSTLSILDNELEFMPVFDK